jgi:uroporphyrinogen decarboxylase
VWEPLPREEVIKAVERRGPERIPLAFARWWGEGLVQQYGARLDELQRYPEDIRMLWVTPYDVTRMNLSWPLPGAGAHDARPIIDDWAKLDEFIAKLPDPYNDPQFDELVKQADKYRAEGLYLMFGWWSLLFERPWGIRGMQNLLTDYYLEPDNVHKLHAALCQHYIRYIQVSIEAFSPDGFWTSDDLGHQTQLMMRPHQFRDLIMPYYGQISEVLRAHKLHWWLHSCGNNTDIMGDLAGVGIDVFHPVQKHTMDEVAVAHDYGARMTFLAGIDVQHTLQERDPAGVREEVRFLIDTFDRPDGGMAIAAGNGIVSGTPFENIEAFLDEALTYGEWHRQQFKR